jgi:hypothetical protein
MPIFAVVPVPFWNITEFPKAPVLFVQSGRKSVVPVPDTAGVTPVLVLFALAVEESAPVGGAASINADAGRPPPTVSASTAFNAYGTLSSRTPGCSSPLLMRTPSRRASPDVNTSSGNPAAFVAPSWTV